MAEVYLMFLVDMVLFGIITWYFDRVKPGPFGIARPWNFLCKVSIETKHLSSLIYQAVCTSSKVV